MNTGSKAILISGATELFDLLAPSFSQWAIYATGTSNPVIQPDSFSTLEFRGEATSANYPLEQGAFASYNKVKLPFSMRLQLVCDNHNMSRTDFLRQLEYMRLSTDLYDIASPDGFYRGVTLLRYDYKRTSRSGVTMITAEAVFEQVNDSGTASYSASQTANPVVSSNSPSAASPKNIGTATTAQPTPAQLLALQRGIQ